MKVYICFKHVYNGCDEWANVVKVMSNEARALKWTQEVESTEYEWRTYSTWEVV